MDRSRSGTPEETIVLFSSSVVVVGSIFASWWIEPGGLMSLFSSSRTTDSGRWTGAVTEGLQSWPTTVLFCPPHPQGAEQDPPSVVRLNIVPYKTHRGGVKRHHRVRGEDSVSSQSGPPVWSLFVPCPHLHVPLDSGHRCSGDTSPT